MFGGHPGTFDFKASLLSSHGFASLTLAFFGVEGLPRPEIKTLDSYPPYFGSLDLKYFENAVDYLIAHKDVHNYHGVGVMCLSGSGPIGLMMAVHIKHVRCVIHMNGPNYANYGQWTYGDHTYESIDSTPALSTDDEDPSVKVYRYNVEIDDVFKPNPIESLIKYYDCRHVSNLFLAGLADKCGPVNVYHNAIESQLEKAKHPDYKVIRYPNVGHLIEPPFGIHNRKTWFPAINAYLDWGGETTAHCHAQLSAWEVQLEFLKRHLSNIRGIW